MTGMGSYFFAFACQGKAKKMFLQIQHNVDSHFSLI